MLVSCMESACFHAGELVIYFARPRFLLLVGMRFDQRCVEESNLGLRFWRPPCYHCTNSTCAGVVTTSGGVRIAGLRDD